MIVAVTGLAREARIVGGPGIQTVAGGGDANALELRLAKELTRGVQRVISIGICGALAPELRVGDAVIASKIIGPDNSYSTDEHWSQTFASLLPIAVVAPIAGTNEIAADREMKALLRARTGASAIDMESHIAARLAQRAGIPFAALRVVSDTADRTLPAAVRVAMLPSGNIDITAVLRSLIRSPGQIPSLIRTAWESEIAFAALLRCRRAIDFGLGADLGELAVDMR
jgi:hopanoid-associated phosphorylase